MLQNKNILLGVCASIAAYKAAVLVRQLVKSGANVRVIMTPDAISFITPLTLSTLSKNSVLVDYYKKDTSEWNNHVELGMWADFFLIAPLSANTLSKLASGQSDNLLTATYLSAKCPLYFAPAMDLDMWKHPSTQENIQRLISFGNILIPPRYGELASGLVGEGRMAEPEAIIEFLSTDIKKKSPLNNVKVLITAGPTYEAIDPVRFIGNHSSGKMGYTLAEEFLRSGAQVTLISGPTALEIQHSNLNKISVTSAQEMLEACMNHLVEQDIIIMSAAVADYTPIEVAEKKIKKQEANLTISLKKTTDILATIGARKSKHQLLIGFALETDNELSNAITKLYKKNLDLIVLNSLQDKGAGFKSDTNKITIVDAQKRIFTYALKSKKDVAKDIIDKIREYVFKETV